MRRLEFYLQIHFALLAALGGLLLGFGEQSGSLPAIAVLTSLFAFVFVDWLKLFALPPVLGYLAMGAIAAYCIGEFIPLSPANNRQLIAVAQLLVLVQAVLMLQQKTRRTFEQIGIFCLLEIVVAAVFNHALTFAMLFVPIALIGLSALVLLQAYSLAQPLTKPLASPAIPTPHAWMGNARLRPKHGAVNGAHDWAQTASPSSVRRLTVAGLQLPRPAIASLGPAVLLVGMVFFYAIPRTAESDGVSLGAAPQVGFSDAISLQQIGGLQQNKSIVMRVALADATTEQPYMLNGEMYLRGRTLNAYDFIHSSGQWQATKPPGQMHIQPLPREYFPQRTTDNLFFDRVNVTISQQPLSTKAAFSIPPYYAIGPAPEVRHMLERWLLLRADDENTVSRSRITYRFGTHAYHNGTDSDLLRCYAPGEEVYLPRSPIEEGLSLWRREDARFDRHKLPELAKTAKAVVDSMPPETRQPHAIARRLSQFVAQEAGLRYTLDLTMKHDPDLDPVEEFLTINRAGHCQYFASALALMLRSQGIPSRLVVGYKTNEYSPFSQRYIVRQSHAHAWVEAYLNETQVPDETVLYVQPQAGPVWMRLDPTPAANASDEDQVTQAVDHMQNLWEQWVIDMNGKRQRDAGLGEAGVGGSFSLLLRGFALKLRQLTTGELGGGSLAAGKWFSLPAAMFGIVAALGAIIFYRVKLPKWRWKRASRHGTAATHVAPQLDFYADVCEQLRRLGMERAATETPREWIARALHSLPERPQLRTADTTALASPLRRLTDLYYSIRFGRLPESTATSPDVLESIRELHNAVEQLANPAEVSA